MEAEPQTQADETDAPQTANDNTATREGSQARLDGLYKRLPKIIARIRDDTLENELGNAFRSLLKTFREINALEEKLQPPGSNFVPLSLTRLYDLAASGGDDKSRQELEEANRGFADENLVLSELVQSLTFQLDTLKRQNVDQEIATGKAQSLNLQELRTSLRDVSGTIEKIEEQMKILSAPNQSPDKPLDERLAEELGGLDKITTEMLRASPSNIGFIGRALRRVGFAYDHKDMVTVRQLVVALAKANRRISEIGKTLEPVKAQVDKLHQVIALAELYAGHEEREGPQYKEAMAENERLNARIARYVEQLGQIEDLENDFKTKKAEIEESLNSATQERENVLAKKLADIAALDEHLKDLSGRKAEITAALDAKAAECEELKKTNADLTADKAASSKKIEGLNEEIADLTREKTERHSQVADLKHRMRMMESGYLAEKLEAEIVSLRGMIESYEAKAQEEKVLREAFEERIGIWVSREEDLQESLKRWRKAAGLKFAFTAAVAGVAVSAGYALGAFGAPKVASTGLWGYWTVATALPALIGMCIGGSEEHGWDKFKKGLGGTAIGAAVGAVFGLALMAPVGWHNSNVEDEADAKAKAEVLEAETKWKSATVRMLKECRDAPCQLVIRENGAVVVEVLSKKFNGGQVTYDFRDKDKPTVTVTTTAPLLPAAQPK